MHKNAFARGAAFVLALTISVGLAACGDNQPVPQHNSQGQVETESGHIVGEFAGSGASSQQSANEAWIAGFQYRHTGARISYDPAGSGAGVTAFLNGSVIWAGTDEPLSDDQVEQSKSVCAGSSAFELPVYVTPIALAYNLPQAGLNKPNRHLNMDPVTIAQIFQGQITRWNDRRLAELNPDVELPDLAITVIHRSDKSGTTKSLLKYMEASAGPAWPYQPGQNWPNDIGQGAKGTAGLVMTLTQAEGTFGYADVAQTNGLGTVAVRVGSSYVPATEQTAAAMLEHKVTFKPQGANSLRKVLDVDYATNKAGTYPILLISYDVVCKAYRNDANGKKADFAKSWLTYLESDSGQQQSASNAGSVPLSSNIRQGFAHSVREIGVA
ncbi:phosphate ABC transporter substrate-binding protein PstS [Bombiscardovia coagulans]|uniref:Phosphate-binding protein n=1 Tax=Bombiscardovia coagulans TaxID=686666 RepID=A0A261EUV5_9BIFI|nr:phosphate ABC transporter substrate-binding protein PstS [Bombiscardovia coagulans]OZG50642.1 phosphate ABC transporter substrate-binding protein [Bombiscardovia coagulans]